jgi:hypothetical protein
VKMVLQVNLSKGIYDNELLSALPCMCKITNSIFVNMEG